MLLYTLPEQAQVPLCSLVSMCQQGGPALLDGQQQRQGGLYLGSHDGLVLPAALHLGHNSHRRQILMQKIFQRLDDADLIFSGLLDIDPFNIFTVFRQTLQGNHHVLIDLEGIGMGRDGRGPRPVQPEAVPGLRTDGDETFGLASIGDTHDIGHCRAQQALIVTGHIQQQHHLGQLGSGRLGGIINRSQITFI